MDKLLLNCEHLLGSCINGVIKSRTIRLLQCQLPHFCDIIIKLLYRILLMVIACCGGYRGVKSTIFIDKCDKKNFDEKQN